MYSSTFSLPQHRFDVSGQLRATNRFTVGKIRQYQTDVQSETFSNLNFLFNLA
jgi:hypothetical protein